MAQSLTKRFTDRISASLGGKRSSKWPRIRNAFHDMYPLCAACGSKKRTQVHHIEDFSTSPDKELDMENLITLCMHHHCHLIIGHLGTFKSINPIVVEMSSFLRGKMRNRRQ